MKLENEKFLVVGLGKTGMGTARFLAAKGAEVRVSDNGSRAKLREELRELEGLGIPAETGGHSRDSFAWAETIILSPGVPFTSARVKEALDMGKIVMSEVELASRFIRAPIIGVTGSNGKTTTATLIASILKAHGKRVFLGGNIGTPLITIAGADEGYDYVVAELSSFQLQAISSFAPFIGVILNVSQNHLDHHAYLNEYVESKMRLFKFQNEAQFAVYNAQDPVIAAWMDSVQSTRVPFGTASSLPPDTGAVLEGSAVTFMGERYDLSGIRLIGRHNLENSMAAIVTTRLAGCPADLIEREVARFEPLEHRIEFIGEFCGARFYNDSKSTSPGATLRALESFGGPVILIAGGKDKGVSFGALKGEIKEKAKRVVLLGEARERMSRELGNLAPTILADDLKDAVEKALEDTGEGDTVLFSPACSSFDMFSSYEERGRSFKSVVKDIHHGK